MNAPPRVWVLSSLFVLALALGARLDAYTVSGNIKDSNGDNVTNIKVEVRDKNLIGSELIEAVYTDANGDYSTDEAEEDQDVYIVVVYEMPLTGNLANGKKAYMVYDDAASPHKFSTYSLPDGYFPDITGNVVINVPTGGQGQGGTDAPEREIQAIQYIQDVLNCFGSKQVAGWTCPCDLGLDVRTVPPQDAWGGQTDGPEGQIEVGVNRLRDGISAFDRSMMGHENGHIFQYKAYGGWPESDYLDDSHQVDSTYDEGYAICEGWGYFVGHAVAVHIGHPEAGVPTNDQTWRGNNLGEGWNRATPVLATDTGTDYNGDYCAGAMTHVWKQLAFTEVFDVVIKDVPQTPQDFACSYEIRFGNAKFLTLLDIYAERGGIVYSRAELRGFTAPDPPNDAQDPPDQGNHKPIDGITFIRGKVKLNDGTCSKDDLNLGANASCFNPSQRKLGYKAAAAGLGEACPVGNWTWLAAVNWVPDYEFDTTAIPDGDYDTIVQVKTTHGWWDNFDPDFANDSVANRDTDEKWLMYLKTWYYRFDNPLDHSPPDPAQENNRGKVIIDNTRPTISNCKPAPN